MLQTPLLKVLHDSQSTLSHQGRVPGQIVGKLQSVVTAAVSAQLKAHLFPLRMWPWCISPCLHLKVCPYACKESLFCA